MTPLLTGRRVGTVLHATATGATHVARGVGSDDAVRRIRTRQGAVAAVADGHSDPRCIRARRGAEFAVEAAVLAGARATTAGDLAEGVVAVWRRLVDADLRARPQPGVEQLDRLAYGTTVLVSCASPAGVLLLRVGDGDIVVVHGDGSATRPLDEPAKEPTASTGINTLAADDLSGALETAVIPSSGSPLLVLLATDGVDNAYPSATALLDAAVELAAQFPARTRRGVSRELRRWVSAAAETSGDDATVAVLHLPGTKE